MLYKGRLFIHHVLLFLILFVTCAGAGFARAGFLSIAGNPAQPRESKAARSTTHNTIERAAQNFSTLDVVKQIPSEQLRTPGSKKRTDTKPKNVALAGNLTTPVDPEEAPFGAPTIYEASGLLRGTLICLAPWDGRSGFYTEWFGPSFAQFTTMGVRVIELTGKTYHHSDADYVGWYTYDNWQGEVPDKRSLGIAVDYVHSIIIDQYHRGVDFQRISLLGYSQGANLALEAGFRFKYSLGLVFSQRGVLYEERLNDGGSYPTTPFILTAGEWDTTYSEGMVKGDCRRLVEKEKPAFMKLVPELDHTTVSEQENRLALKAVEVVVTQEPSQIVTSLAAFDGWTSLNY